MGGTSGTRVAAPEGGRAGDRLREQRARAPVATPGVHSLRAACTVQGLAWCGQCARVRGVGARRGGRRGDLPLPSPTTASDVDAGPRPSAGTARPHPRASPAAPPRRSPWGVPALESLCPVKWVEVGSFPHQCPPLPNFLNEENPCVAQGSPELKAILTPERWNYRPATTTPCSKLLPTRGVSFSEPLLTFQTSSLADIRFGNDLVERCHRTFWDGL